MMLNVVSLTGLAAWILGIMIGKALIASPNARSKVTVLVLILCIFLFSFQVGYFLSLRPYALGAPARKSPSAKQEFDCNEKYEISLQLPKQR
jgi:hypothetical protein